MAESATAIYGAMAANLAIAVTKFAVAGVTGSSAMLSEGVHSLVDTGDSILLLVGLHRSRRAPSADHPFGHGKELYFWSLIVAVLIFGLGGGVSVYEGVQHIRAPEPLADPFWNYVVLACAAVFESISLGIGLRQFLRQHAGQPFWKALRSSKDPSTFTVIAEDSAALAGLAIAAAGIAASQALGMPELDGVASLLIGVLLAGVAILLIRQSRGLLVGEGIRPETAAAIREIAHQEPGVTGVGPILSMYVGAGDALVTMDLTLREHCSAGEVTQTIRRIEQRVRERFPTLRRIYIEPVAALTGGAQPA
ncbi:MULTISPECIES: cation diffusion facilitator family transporter [Ramlibacter]|uniref:Cation transporter n=1 Tax=Ramlibacter aquaticus TaxID=2780094 RepID=A0ABR9SDE5_9BURK|nr:MULTISPECIES: cation diffusion facilitator family transporter [Ramlibacter]MBE7940377.1 cation transporter [Ramlibacter aquaticus]